MKLPSPPAASPTPEKVKLSPEKHDAVAEALADLIMACLPHPPDPAQTTANRKNKKG